MIIIDKNRSNLSKNYRLERNKQSFIIVLTGSEERHKTRECHRCSPHLHLLFRILASFPPFSPLDSSLVCLSTRDDSDQDSGNLFEWRSPERLAVQWVSNTRWVQHEQPEKRLARHGSGAKNDDLQEAGGQSSQNQERYRSS